MGAFHVLGVNDGHNAGAALVVDGVLTYAASEERFVRRKNAGGMPWNAIEDCLRTCGVDASELTLIVLTSRALHPLWAALEREDRFGIDDYLFEQSSFLEHLPGLGSQAFSQALESYVDSVRERKGREDLRVHLERWSGWNTARAIEQFASDRRNALAIRLQVPGERVLLADHHQCHAAYGFFGSPYVCDNAPTLVLTLDAQGDGVNATASVGGSSRLHQVHRTATSDISRLYRAVTLCMGMKPQEHEFKVMGLAPYAPEYEKRRAELRLAPLWQEVDELEFKYSGRPIPYQRLFSELSTLCPGLRFDGIAAALQAYLEDCVSKWVQAALAKYPSSRLVLAGGAAMNVKMVGRLCQLPMIEHCFVPPGPGDESLPAGAAWKGWEMIHIAAGGPAEMTKPLEHAWLGPLAGDTDLSALTDHGMLVGPMRPDVVARDLANGYIVGRCAGRMEFGPRALGNRSILADPADPLMAARLNTRVKCRDFWMPFAPLTLARHSMRYFELPAAADTRFMTTAGSASKLCIAHAPAAVHPADHSVRPQVLHEADNPKLAAILDAFETHTGRGVLVNTSLNVHGEPIVLGARRAMAMMKSGLLDGLVLDDAYVRRP
ncbi:MAG: hypothetical protein GY930_21600 [bacterium]|nr:hypothetical protein [bacterium]